MTSSDKVLVTLDGVPETLFIPLAARAADARSPYPVLGDDYANDLVDKLDYDFSKVSLSAADSAKTAVRTRHFDGWVVRFIARHPDAVILHLACGLDARMQRVQWGPSVTWVDVDLPEVIALRRQVMSVALPGRDYHLVGADILDGDWIPNVGRERPTAVVMEGLVSYLAKDEIRMLFKHLVKHFDKGELLFECISDYFLKNVHRVDSIRLASGLLQTAINDPKELEKWGRLHLLEATNFVEAPGIVRLSWMARFSMYVASWIPGARDTVKLVRMTFGEEM